MRIVQDVLRHPAVAGSALVLSIVMFVAGLVAVPWIVARLPADYFVRESDQEHVEPRHPALRTAGRIFKNVIGAMLVLVGIAMLILPGQGVLTILMGLSLVSFPGKRQLQRRLLHLPGVSKVVGAIRRRAGQPPLLLGAPHGHRPERDPA